MFDVPSLPLALKEQKILKCEDHTRVPAFDPDIVYEIILEESLNTRAKKRAGDKSLKIFLCRFIELDNNGQLTAATTSARMQEGNPSVGNTRQGPSSFRRSKTVDQLTHLLSIFYFLFLNNQSDQRPLRLRKGNCKTYLLIL